MSSASLPVIAGRPPVAWLAGLSALVLLAHLWMLSTTALPVGASDSFGRKVFSTRVLEIGAPAPAAEAVAPARPSPAPAPSRAVPPRPLAAETGSPAPATEKPAATTEAAVAAPMPAGSAALAIAAPPAPPPEPPPPPKPAPVEPVAAAPAPAPASPPAAVAPPAPGTSGLTVAAPGAPLARDSNLPPRRYAIPGSVRLKFNATGSSKRLDYQALGELAWLHDGKTYEARLSMTAWPMSRSITSTGRLSGDGLLPERFSDRFRSELAAHFDRDRARVVFSANTPEAALLPGAQDQLSVFVQLAAMMAGDPTAYPVGTSFSVQTVGPRAAEPWVFVFEGEETLSLPGGHQPARKLVRTPRRDYDQKVEIWLAPALSWLPARIRITQPNGDFIDQQWRSTSTP